MFVLDIETDQTAPGTLSNAWRYITGIIDIVFFTILKGVYEIFFGVATAEFFSNATIRSLYGRIQIILGVFMVFRLTIIVLQTLVDPDKVNDKNEGFSAVIKRVVIGLLLLAALTPINIPNASEEYEIELNNNGLIFGTLYSLQNRILANNTIGRIVLGTSSFDVANADADPNSTTATDLAGQKVSQMANIFTSTIMRVFIRINLKQNHQTADENADYQTNPENWMCDIENDVLAQYTALDAEPSELASYYMLTTTCGEGKIGKLIHKALVFTNPMLGVIGGAKQIFEKAFDAVFKHNLFNKSKARYAFVHIPIIGSIVAIILSVILIGFTVDIAIRAVKLAVLRVIAPIPIIAYMGPQSKENTAFSNWVKALISTYLDLFIRLAVIFFVLFLVQDLMINGITINVASSGFIKGLTMIFIIIALFIFARQAPQFIKEVLGIKSFGTNIGLATIMGGLGSIRGGVSGMGYGALSAFRQQTDALAEGKQAPGVMDAYRQSTDVMAKIRTGDKDAHGGALGYLQDRLEYSARNRALGRLGMDETDYAIAKYNKDRAESDAAYAQANFDRVAAKYQRGEATEAEYKEAYAQNQEMQTVAGKAAKTFKAIDEARSKHGAAPRLIDTAQETYRSAYKVKTKDRYYELKWDDDAKAEIWTAIDSKDLPSDIEMRVRNNPERYRREDYAVNALGEYAHRNKDGKFRDAAVVRDAKSFDGTGDDRIISMPTSGRHGDGH